MGVIDKMTDTMWKEVCDSIDGYWSLVDSIYYAKYHPIEAIECARNHGSIHDMDTMVEISNKLGKFPISYELYHYINDNAKENIFDVFPDDEEMIELLRSFALNRRPEKGWKIDKYSNAEIYYISVLGIDISEYPNKVVLSIDNDEKLDAMVDDTRLCSNPNYRSFIDKKSENYWNEGWYEYYITLDLSDKENVRVTNVYAVVIGNDEGRGEVEDDESIVPLNFDEKYVMHELWKHLDFNELMDGIEKGIANGKKNVYVRDK